MHAGPRRPAPAVGVEIRCSVVVLAGIRRAPEMKKMIILRSKLRSLMPIMSYLGVLRLSRAQWELVAS